MPSQASVATRMQTIDNRLKSLEARKKPLMAQLAQIDREIQAALAEKSRVMGQEALIAQQKSTKAV